MRRRPSSFEPFFSSAFTRPEFSSLADIAEQMQARADEMFRNVSDFPQFSMVDRFPALNVSEAKGEFIVTAELPGMTEKDVTIDYCDGVLTIRGEKEREEMKEEDDRKYYLWERRFGSFQRSLPFPGGINEDKIDAKFKNGVLTVHLPKVEEAKAKHREIPVSAN
jgi:HSP20 family protein